MRKKLISLGLLLALAGCGRQIVKTDDVKAGLDDVYSKFVAYREDACSPDKKEKADAVYIALKTFADYFKLEEPVQ